MILYLNKNGKNWLKNPINYKEPKRFPFIGKPGVKLGNKVLDKSLDYLELFFDSTLIKNICDQSNIYEEQNEEEDWTEIKPKEMWKFLGMKILMGLVVLPEERSYWSEDEKFDFKYISSKMTRNRFMKIKQYLNFSDN